MRCFVTGGSGFLGSHLIDKLRGERHNVFNYDIEEGYDILDKEKLFDVMNTENPDVIFHLAGLLGTSELMAPELIPSANKVNITGTCNILEAARIYKVPVVYTSKPTPFAWRNTYTITKLAADHYCKMYHDWYDVEVCIMKPYNAYGPRQKTYPVEKIIPRFIMAAINDEPIPIYGSGLQRIDLIYVTDVAEAMYRAWRNKCWGETIGFGCGGLGVTVKEVAEKIIEKCGSNSDLVFLPMRTGEVLNKKSTCADTDAINRLLGIETSDLVPMEEGVEKTIEWFKNEIV